MANTTRCREWERPNKKRQRYFTIVLPFRTCIDTYFFSVRQEKIRWKRYQSSLKVHWNKPTTEKHEQSFYSALSWCNLYLSRRFQLSTKWATFTIDVLFPTYQIDHLKALNIHTSRTNQSSIFFRFYVCFSQHQFIFAIMSMNIANIDYFFSLVDCYIINTQLWTEKKKEEISLNENTLKCVSQVAI